MVVDLIFHSIIGSERLSAICLASSVFPVPGSPFTKRGRSRVIDALTAKVKSSVEIYFDVPSNFIKFPFQSNKIFKSYSDKR